MKQIGQITVSFIGGIFITLLRAWVLTKLWGWFIVPTFLARPLHVIEAVGIALICSFLTCKIPSYKDSKEAASENAMEALFYGWGLSVAISFMSLFGGWIYQFFLP